MNNSSTFARRLIFIVLLACGIYGAFALAGYVSAAVALASVPPVGIAPHGAELRKAFRRICSSLGLNIATREKRLKAIRQVPLSGSAENVFSALGSWYDSAPVHGQSDSYALFRRETLAQLEALEKAGFSVHVASHDPYDNAEAMARHARTFGELLVRGTVAHGDLSGFADHPLAAPARDPRTGLVKRDASGQAMLANDVFRAVHDALTHCLLGSDAAAFTHAGEFRATLAHSLLYSRAALPALLNEAGAQIAWMFNRGTLETFPTQKVNDVPSYMVRDMIRLRDYGTLRSPRQIAGAGLPEPPAPAYA